SNNCEWLQTNHASCSQPQDEAKFVRRHAARRRQIGGTCEAKFVRRYATRRRQIGAACEARPARRRSADCRGRGVPPEDKIRSGRRLKSTCAPSRGARDVAKQLKIAVLGA